MMWLLFRLGDADALVIEGRLDGVITSNPVFDAGITAYSALNGRITTN